MALDCNRFKQQFIHFFLSFFAHHTNKHSDLNEQQVYVLSVIWLYTKIIKTEKNKYMFLNWQTLWRRTPKLWSLAFWNELHEIKYVFYMWMFIAIFQFHVGPKTKCCKEFLKFAQIADRRFDTIESILYTHSPWFLSSSSPIFIFS